uniref:Steroid-binding protein 3 n=2 Tax=Cajanus cajan TaxID=3821 RepID=A0A151RNW4_CAJCA|nr:putative steroid-binding protein 3 [Cajanus cajan]
MIERERGVGIRGVREGGRIKDKLVEGQRIRIHPSSHLISSTLPESMELTPQQLSQYNGTDPSKPIYVAVKGRVYDVTTGKSFYGPGGPYAMFAGRDASRALAKMSKNDEDISPSLDGLSDKEIGVLNDWENKFQAKYPVVARLLN